MNDLGFGIALQLEDQFSQTAGKVETHMDNLEKRFQKLGAQTFLFNQMGEAVQHLQRGLNLIEGPGQIFEKSLAEVSAITGVVGNGLVIIGDKALDLNRKFGTGAEGNLTMFKTILSRLGPDIAEAPEALDSMANSINTLSKTMNGDVLGATDSLTTSINIYASDVTDAIEKSRIMTNQMNVMAAAAQIGSAEVPQISDSIKVAGLAAKAAGVEFEELNTLIQIMGRGSVYGAEAGTALRNVLAIMSQGRYMPRQAREGLIAAGVDIQMLGDATVPVKDRLIELSKIQNDSALISETFGRENSNAARVLLSNLSVYDQWKQGITGTNSANEQAAVIMDTYSEKMARAKAFLENMAIGIFNATKEALPFIQGLLSILLVVTNLGPAFASFNMVLTWLKGSMIVSAFSSFGLAGGLEFLSLVLMETAAAAWAALAPFLPVIAVFAAVAAVVWGISEAMDYFKTSLSGTGQAATGFLGLVQKIGGIFTALGEILFGGGISGDTATMLEKIGLDKFMFKVEGWANRIGYLFDGIGIAFSQTWEVVSQILDILSDAFSTAFDFVADVLQGFGIDISASTIHVQDWVKAGQIIGYLIVGTLIPAVAGLVIGMGALAISVIAATWPFIAIAAAIYGIYYLFTNWGEVMDWLSGKWGEFVDWIGSGVSSIGDWFSGLVDQFVGFGEMIVGSIAEGISSAWDMLTNLLTGLISGLPGGSAILELLGVETGASANGAKAIQKPIPNLVEAVQDRTATAQTPGRNFEKITETQKLETVKFDLIMDGQVIASQVNDINALNASRNNGG